MKFIAELLHNCWS